MLSPERLPTFCRKEAKGQGVELALLLSVDGGDVGARGPCYPFGDLVGCFRFVPTWRTRPQVHIACCAGTGVQACMASSCTPPGIDATAAHDALLLRPPEPLQRDRNLDMQNTSGPEDMGPRDLCLSQSHETLELGIAQKPSLSRAFGFSPKGDALSPFVNGSSASEHHGGVCGMKEPYEVSA